MAREWDATNNNDPAVFVDMHCPIDDQDQEDWTDVQNKARELRKKTTPVGEDFWAWEMNQLLQQ